MEPSKTAEGKIGAASSEAATEPTKINDKKLQAFGPTGTNIPSNNTTGPLNIPPKSNNIKPSNAVASNAGSNAGSNANSEKEKEKPYFYYTQKEFWGGANANYTILAILSIIPFTGFFGLDHLYLRSPLSALLKTVFNVLTLGLWYFYDIAQVTGESDIVKEKGMSYPILGPTGLGAGIFVKEKEEPKGPNPFMFWLYALFAIIPLPYALDYFVAGDIYGGIVKVIANFNILLWIFSIFGSLLVLYKLFFKTDTIFNEGIPRFFPFTLLMDTTYCSRNKIGPDKECTSAEESEGLIAFFKKLLQTLKGIPVIGALVGLIDDTINYGKRLAPALVTAGTAVAGLAPKVASEVMARSSALTDPKQYVPAPAKVTAPAVQGQKGGSRDSADEHTSLLLFVAFASMAALGVFIAKLQKMEVVDIANAIPRNLFSLFRYNYRAATRFGPARRGHYNDSPPQPGAI